MSLLSCPCVGLFLTNPPPALPDNLREACSSRPPCPNCTQSIPDNSEARGEVRRDSGLFEFRFWPKLQRWRGLPTFPTVHLTLLLLSPLENHFFLLCLVFWKKHHSINTASVFFFFFWTYRRRALTLLWLFTWLKTKRLGPNCWPLCSKLSIH